MPVVPDVPVEPPVVPVSPPLLLDVPPEPDEPLEPDEPPLPNEPEEPLEPDEPDEPLEPDEPPELAVAPGDPPPFPEMVPLHPMSSPASATRLAERIDFMMIPSSALSVSVESGTGRASDRREQRPSGSRRYTSAAQRIVPWWRAASLACATLSPRFFPREIGKFTPALQAACCLDPQGTKLLRGARSAHRHTPCWSGGRRPLGTRLDESPPLWAHDSSSVSRVTSSGTTSTLQFEQPSWDTSLPSSHSS